jgi:hypothetical protein
LTGKIDDDVEAGNGSSERRGPDDGRARSPSDEPRLGLASLSTSFEWM